MQKSSGVLESVSGRGLRIGIVASRFNGDITKKLCDGARHMLVQKGVRPADVEIVWTPGAFEIPFALQTLACRRKKKIDGLIALGAVIRGETPHFDYVCNGVTDGVMRVMLDEQIPIAFGVLTTNTVDQAIERIGGKYGHKGEEAALVVLEMVHCKKGKK